MTPPGSPVLVHGFRVEAEEDAVPEARHRIIALVNGWNVTLSEEQLAEVELLSTEVITNAIRHTQAACAVTVRWTGARVRIEVTDTDPVHPRSARTLPDAEGGRGLLLVDALAAAWGCADDPAGKVVWFEVGPRTEAAAWWEQPAPWSTPGAWTITSTDGTATSGYLPAWAEDDPTEVGVPLSLLPLRLAEINHRAFFEGSMMPLTTTEAMDDAEEDAVFEGSIDCNPYDPDPRLRIPVANLQLCLGRWILRLDPQGLADIAAKLRAQADRLHHDVLPALIAARDDWAAHRPPHHDTHLQEPASHPAPHPPSSPRNPKPSPGHAKEPD